MKRTIRKTIAAVMSLIVTIGAFSLNGLKAYADSDNVDISSKYATKLNVGDYDNYLRMNDSFFFMSDTDKSSETVKKSNTYDCINLNADSKIKYVDSAGNITVINNSNQDGTAKYDAIYGCITTGYYKYTVVRKGEKTSLIDSTGELAGIINDTWYDDILKYNTVDGTKLYVLKEMVSDTVYNVTIIDEEGNLIYKQDNCNSFKVIGNYTYFIAPEMTGMYYIPCFIIMTTNDNRTIVIDVKGNILHNEYDDIEIMYYDSNAVSYKTKDFSNTENQWIAIQYGQYNNGITYDDGVILVSNVSESTYSSRCNLNKKVSLSSDSVLAYYDKNGKNHVLENKDSDGNKKYDAIYGTVSQMTYKYTIVEKDSKLGTIDNAGNQITLNNKQWYDDIDLYETEEGKYLYGLKENKDDKIFDYTLVDENGNVIFTKKDCTYIHAFARWITDVCETYFMLFVDAEGYATLVDVNGKVWSEGKKYVKVGPTAWSTSHTDMTAVLVFDNEYGYYNYTTGEMYEKPGTIRHSNSKETRYMVNNDGKTYVYDRYMEAELIIDGEYADIVSINGTGKGKSAYLLKNSDNKYVNGCNKDGSKWFDEDFEIKDTSLSMNSAEGVILTYDDNSKYFVPDGGENQYLLSDLQSIAINKIKSVPGNENVALNNMRYVLADFGVVFYITINNVKYSAVVTKASGYKDAVYLEDGITGYVIGSYGGSSNAYGYIYLSSAADKTITLNDGSTVECNRKMIKMYNMYGQCKKCLFGK